MTKLTLDHVGSLARASHSMLKDIQPGMYPRFVQAIEGDITRLEELRSFVLIYIYNPEFPDGSANQES